LVCTFHPAYLLRNASQKASTWQDLLLVHEILTRHQEGK
jgi:uracil-DNA glycosylase